MELPGQLKRKGVVDHKRKGLERDVPILGRQQINGRKKILQESGGLPIAGQSTNPFFQGDDRKDGKARGCGESKLPDR